MKKLILIATAIAITLSPSVEAKGRVKIPKPKGGHSVKNEDRAPLINLAARCYSLAEELEEKEIEEFVAKAFLTMAFTDELSNEEMDNLLSGARGYVDGYAAGAEVTYRRLFNSLCGEDLLKEYKPHVETFENIISPVLNAKTEEG